MRRPGLHTRPAPGDAITQVARIVLAAAALSACTRSTAPDAYRSWLARDGHAADVAAYADFLRAEGVAEVVPMEDMLRTSRAWRRCGHAAHAVPPRATWPRIVPTLRLIARIEAETGLSLDAVRSGWRDETVNGCAGGAARSRHLENVALDIDLPPPSPKSVETGDAPLDRLCGFWRRHGKTEAMGLGFYTPTRIHIDTAGHRTWGNDHHRGTSLCVKT